MLGMDLTFQNYTSEYDGLPGKYALPDGRLYVAYCDGRLAGVVALRRFDERRGEVKRMFVRPEFRRLGIGQALVERLIEESRLVGYESLVLDSDLKLEASILLYKKLGFREIEPYYHNPHPGSVYYRLDLKRQEPARAADAAGAVEGGANIKPVWIEGERVLIVDQTRLPSEYRATEIRTAEEMADAIKRLAVRGAPAIGLAAAFGIYAGVREASFQDKNGFTQTVERLGDVLAATRPTAVNLFWAVERMKRFAAAYAFTGREAAVAAAREEAARMLEEDVAACRAIGVYGAELLGRCRGVLTHCNAGALATSGYGTALAPIYVLRERGHKLKVYADETRPLLQGSRLTAWELSRAGVDVTVICDHMAGDVMKKGWVDAVIVGADRIASNGDTANKIGTYGLSVLAKAHGLPLYVAAPFSTVDLSAGSGADIPIEERGADEIRRIGETQTAPAEAAVYNPAFDVTPAGNITAIITERGPVYPPYEVGLRGIAE
jgi:methylthioribose-1-phosphate isomerase